MAGRNFGASIYFRAELIQSVMLTPSSDMVRSVVAGANDPDPASAGDSLVAGRGAVRTSRTARMSPATVADRATARLGAARAQALAILAGGTLGTLARAGVAEGLPHRAGSWPWATFLVNLGGALLLGWLLTRLAERVRPTRHWRAFLGTGFCGALTTFSTFQIEAFELVDDGHAGLAVAYVLVSVAAGLALAVTGVMLARWGRHW